MKNEIYIIIKYDINFETCQKYVSFKTRYEWNWNGALNRLNETEKKNINVMVQWRWCEQSILIKSGKSEENRLKKRKAKVKWQKNQEARQLRWARAYVKVFLVEFRISFPFLEFIYRFIFLSEIQQWNQFECTQRK